MLYSVHALDTPAVRGCVFRPREASFSVAVNTTSRSVTDHWLVRLMADRGQDDRRQLSVWLYGV